MISWAAHDAQEIALDNIATAMIFLRSSGGSHNPKEDVNMEDVISGTRVLHEALVGLGSKFSLAHA
jgi:acetylornithine deacetylase/succinyl-diaminopimelate desuccinylase-like protein